MISAATYKRLCNQLIARDPKGIEELYDIYGNALYGVILRIVNQEEGATEILQDTFVKAWQNGHSYNPELGRLYTWLMRIARNLAINYVQSKNVRQQSKIQSDEDLVYLGDNKKNAKAMEAFDLKGNVTHLENKYQEVIELIYFRGFTHVEASEHLDIPIGTVKSRIKIALRKLRETYDYRLSTIPAISFILFSMML